ncbi:MAG: ABC transporter permease [Planctomycetota bacterium]|jgi:ABC-type lipoprotein release transport system permease subunit
MYKFVLAIRYLFKRKISYFSVLAVALCVFVVLVVMTVLSGLTSEFKLYVHRATGDCVVSTKSLVGFAYYDEFIKVLNNSEIVQAASPVVKSYAVINDVSEHGRFLNSNIETVGVMGIEPLIYSQVTSFNEGLYHHRTNIAEAFSSSYAPNRPGCVLGIGLLFSRDQEGNYRITEQIPQVKIEVSCVPLTAKGSLAKSGLTEFSTKTFYLSDHAQSGYKADWTLIYLPFEDAQVLCGMAGSDKRASAIHIKFKPDIELEAGCSRIRELWNNFVAEKASARHANLLEKVKVVNWKDYNRMIVAAMESERTAMVLTFGMIGILAVFIVFVVFYMIISHKSKDIGILKSLGVSNINIMILFLNFAFFVGVLGFAIGAVGGWRFLVHINQIEDWLFKNFKFQLWDRTMYAIGDIPNTIDLKLLGLIAVSAIFACLAGAIIPSWKAARLQPVKTLQVNRL